MSASPKIAYNIATAAAQVSMSEYTVRRAIKAKELLAKRSGKNGGGYYVIQHAELEAWIDSLEDAS